MLALVPFGLVKTIYNPPETAHWTPYSLRVPVCKSGGDDSGFFINGPRKYKEMLDQGNEDSKSGG